MPALTYLFPKKENAMKKNFAALMICVAAGAQAQPKQAPAKPVAQAAKTQSVVVRAKRMSAAQKAAFDQQSREIRAKTSR